VAERARTPELWLHEAWQGRAPVLVRAGLAAAAAAYRTALAARSASFRVGLFSTHRLPVPVISVGNVTVGGSGKTPLAEVVALVLAEMGARPAIISRGYGRRSRGVRIVADGSGVLLRAGEGGDEPVLLAERLPGIPVVVGENRFEAGAVALGRCGAGSLVLDDGFQHKTLAKDLELVAVSGRQPWGSGRLFPRGSLREPLSAFRRADIVVVTNAPSPAVTSDIAHVLRRKGSRAVVLSGSYQATALRRDEQSHSESPQALAESPQALAESPKALAGRRVLVLAGLAAPEGFVATADGLGAKVVGVAEFPDHYWYTAGDLARVVAQARDKGAEAVLTTEKDWVRIRDIPPGPRRESPGPRRESNDQRPQGDMPFWVLSIRLDLGADRRPLVQALADTLKRVAVGQRVS
jgi:tetraacyldisaccharide 4'-kinase